jgi:hypothetical protein
MLSTGMEGARLAAVKLLAAVGLYLFLIYAIGLKLAGLPFAILIPFLFLNGRSRVVTMVIAAGFYWAFASLIGDHLLHLRWPAGWIV